jgi:hypothetical protein
MKLSKRELIMVIGLISVVTIAAFWMLLLSPAKDRLAASQAEYQSVQATDDANQLIINSVSSLDSTRTSLKSDIGKIETSLLPALDVEVISEHFAKIFENHGLHFITEISTEPVVTEQLQLTNGTTSPDSVQWVRVKMKVSGTDGVTDGGIPAVGYNEFIAAVKDIEIAEPSAIHVSSLSMEDTDYGFQYFLISVDVFAYNLQNPIVGTDTNEPYTTWARAPVTTGGVFGVPYANLPKANAMTVPYFRPFANIQVTSGGTTSGNKLTPTPTP